jgi:enoyl-CoA hydratase
MEFENVLLEQPESGIRVLTINRPKVLNALNPETIEEIGTAAAQVAEDPSARVLLVTGAGDKAFVAGADISRMLSMSPTESRYFAARGQRAFRTLEALPVPVIAVVNGFALGGGCELALSCDIILAGESAVFGQPEVNLGVLPGFGGTQRLPRLIGRGMAMELMVTGRQVKAQEARELGLVNHVYADAELMDKAQEMARLIMSKGPGAVGRVKQAVRRGLDMDLDNGCEVEADQFGLAVTGGEHKEGMSAFLERRKPEFKDRSGPL